jgi:hypothetical protein
MDKTITHWRQKGSMIWNDEADISITDKKIWYMKVKGT